MRRRSFLTHKPAVSVRYTDAGTVHMDVSISTTHPTPHEQLHFMIIIHIYTAPSGSLFIHGVGNSMCCSLFAYSLPSCNAYKTRFYIFTRFNISGWEEKEALRTIPLSKYYLPATRPISNVIVAAIKIQPNAYIYYKYFILTNKYIHGCQHFYTTKRCEFLIYNCSFIIRELLGFVISNRIKNRVENIRICSEIFYG